MTIDERNEMVDVFQRNLKLIRIMLGLSIKDLANIAHVSRQTITSLETNRYKMPVTTYIALVVIVNYIISKDTKLSYVLPLVINIDSTVNNKIYDFDEFKII